jgi:hypothetical protein
MNFVDLIAIAGLGVGYLRGRKRGLDRELYRLINVGLLMVGGCGLFKLIGKGLSFLPFLSAENSGLPGFLLGMGVAFVVVRKIRKGLRAALAAKFGTASHRNTAGFVGMARWGVVIVGVVAALVLSRVGVWMDPVTEGSLLGRAVAALLT